MIDKKNISRKKIQATAAMHAILADYYYELDRAAKTGERKIAWCTSVGPAELLRALGFLVFFPENHGAMLGATRRSTDLLPIADAQGYSPDICSYLRADVGAYIQGTTPLSDAYPGIKQVPGPDVLVFNTNQCRDVQDWFGWYARELGVPLLGIHTHQGLDAISDHHIKSIAVQMEELVAPLEAICGNKLDKDAFRDVMTLSRQCSDLWEKVLNTAATAPAPLTFFDGIINMAPAVMLRGTQPAVDYYRGLLDELEQRVKQGVGAVEGERFRIYWDGMPIWGRMRRHSEMFSGLGANVLASTYCNSWIFPDFDADDLFYGMAKAYTSLFIVRSDSYKEAYLRRMLTFFKIDGIIYHEAKCCPCNSNSLYGMPRRIEAVTKIPALTLYGDLNDLRLLSDEQTQTNVEAFIEQLEEGR